MMRKILAFLAVLALPLGAAQAQQGQSLDDYIKAGKITISGSFAGPPLTFLNDKMEPDGLETELDKALAKSLGVKLNLVAVSIPERIPSLLNKKIDIIISGLVPTPERATQIAFTIPYSFSEQVVIAPEAKKIRSLDDLANMKVGVTRGNVHDVKITAIAPKSTTILRFDEAGNVFAALLSGQVDAIVNDGSVARGLIKNNPDKHLEAAMIVGGVPLAMGVRRGDQDLLNWLNTFIFYQKYSDGLEALHKKYELPYNLPTF